MTSLQPDAVLLNTKIDIFIRKYKKKTYNAVIQNIIFGLLLKATINISCIATLTSTVARSAVNAINSC